jgi:hypothetical protein
VIVCWKRRPSRRHGERPAPDGQVLYAFLRERWCDDRRERQRVVRYLGGIHEGHLDRPLRVAQLWKQVDGALDTLGLQAAQRLIVEGQIAEIVPRPNPATVEKAKQDFDARRAGMLAELANPDRGRRLRDSSPVLRMWHGRPCRGRHHISAVPSPSVAPFGRPGHQAVAPANEG